MKPPLSPDLFFLIYYHHLSILLGTLTWRSGVWTLHKLISSCVTSDDRQISRYYLFPLYQPPIPVYSVATSLLINAGVTLWNSKHLLVNRSSSRITLFYDMTLRSLGNLNILCLFRDVCKSYCPGHKGQSTWKMYAILHVQTAQG